MLAVGGGGGAKHGGVAVAVAVQGLGRWGGAGAGLVLGIDVIKPTLLPCRTLAHGKGTAAAVVGWRLVVAVGGGKGWWQWVGAVGGGSWWERLCPAEKGPGSAGFPQGHEGSVQ